MAASFRKSSWETPGVSQHPPPCLSPHRNDQCHHGPAWATSDGPAPAALGPREGSGCARPCVVTEELVASEQ